MTQLRDQTGVGQGFHCPDVIERDDDRGAGISLAQIGDDAVLTRRGFAHDAVITIDSNRRGVTWVSHVPNSTDAL